MIMYQATFRLLNRDVPCEMTAEVIRQAVECSIGAVEQLLQGATLKEWLTHETLEAKVIALTNVCCLHRTEHATRWITETITLGLELGANDTRLWSIIRAIQHYARSLSAWMDWVCRLLDVFIVIASHVHLSAATDALHCLVAWHSSAVSLASSTVMHFTTWSHRPLLPTTQHTG